MFILSKEKDYYDGVAGSMGIDKTIVYDRKTSILTDQRKFPTILRDDILDWDKRYKHPFYSFRNISINKKGYENSYQYQFIIGFCGKLYLGFLLERKWSEYTLYGDNKKRCILYDIDEIKSNIKKKNYFRKVDFDEMYRKFISIDPIKIFREFKSPVFLYKTSNFNNHTELIINPILKEYEFYRVIDSFTAYQEIQMFISGVLGTNENNIIEIDDKYKINQYGFDKWSFRKEPKPKK